MQSKELKSILVHLGENKEYTVTVELFENRVANRIWHIIKEATEINFVSRKQFYEFGETQQEVEANLQEAVDKLKILKPEYFRDADDLNRLHENFPDLVHIETDPETRHWLSMFNYHLHHLERKHNNGKRQFLFCSNLPSEKLEQEDYDLFTISKEENTVYMNYPHVGKHILELVGDNDTDVPADHIVPTSILRPDLLFHLDEDRWIGQEEKVIDYINSWLPKIEHKLPYPIGDKRLALGHIPLGIVLDPDINRIAKNQYIHSIQAVSNL